MVPPKSDKGGWVDYRPEIKVLDCTIRDGGLINDHKFTDAFAKGVYDACVAAGVDYIEMGYKTSKRLSNPKDFGPWKFCDEEDLRRIVGDNKTDVKISIMADAERCDYQTDILPKKESVVDMVRVACYIHQIPIAVDMVLDAKEKGYETCCNIMAASTIQENDLKEGLKVLAETPVDVVYLVDSFGSLYSEEIRDLTKIDNWFLYKMKNIADIEKHLGGFKNVEDIPRGILLRAKQCGTGTIFQSNQHYLGSRRQPNCHGVWWQRNI